jgi:type I restriction enzyme M protein
MQGAIAEVRTPTHAEANVGVPNVTTTYADIPAFCKSATLAEIQKHDFVLTPGRYVGAADDGEAFANKMARLTAQLKSQFEQSDKLEAEIKKNLAGLGYDV